MEGRDISAVQMIWSTSVCSDSYSRQCFCIQVKAFGLETWWGCQQHSAKLSRDSKHHLCISWLSVHLGANHSLSSNWISEAARREMLHLWDASIRSHISKGWDTRLTLRNDNQRRHGILLPNANSCFGLLMKRSSLWRPLVCITANSRSRRPSFERLYFQMFFNICLRSWTTGTTNHCPWQLQHDKTLLRTDDNILGASLKKVRKKKGKESSSEDWRLQKSTDKKII